MKNLVDRIEKVKAGYKARVERVEKIINNTKDEWVEKGYYNVIEYSAEDGWDYTVFKLYIEEGINLKELAIKLMEERDYMSEWDCLRIEKDKYWYD